MENKGLFKKGQTPWNKGKHTGIKTKGTLGYKHTEKWKKEQVRRMSGKNHPNWKGGHNCKICGKETCGNKLKTGACQKCYQKISPTKKGKFHHLWKGGVNRNKHNANWKYIEWRKNVFVRDNFTCQLCKKVGNELNAHHIKEWAKYKELRYEIDNGVTLCVNCHKSIHKKNGRTKV